MKIGDKVLLGKTKAIILKFYNDESTCLIKDEKGDQYTVYINKLLIINKNKMEEKTTVKRTKQAILKDVYTDRIKTLKQNLKYYETNKLKDEEEMKILEGLLKENKLV